MNAAGIGASLLARTASELSRASETLGAGASGNAASSADGSFAKEIGESLSSVNRELNQAEASARELASGKGDLVETMISMGRADISLRMVVNLRNRVLESYQEIMRLQV